MAEKNYPVHIDAWKDLPTQLEACSQLAHKFSEFYHQNFVVKEFNEKNLIIDPKTGKVTLDTHNCLENLEKFKIGMVVPGRYVMPAWEMTDVMNDKTKAVGYTLAILLFEILVGCNPFDGRSLAIKAFIRKDDIRDNYGEKRLFIFDENNNSNAPIPGLQGKVINKWNSLPEDLKNGFIKAFSEGKALLSPQDWISRIEKAKESIIVCPTCRKKTFFRIHSKSACSCCESTIDATYSLRFFLSGKVVPLVEGLDVTTNGTIGKVIKKDGNLWIQNVTNRSWSAVTPKGVDKQVNPNGLMPLIPGIKVKINGNDCIIE